MLAESLRGRLDFIFEQSAAISVLVPSIESTSSRALLGKFSRGRISILLISISRDLSTVSLPYSSHHG